MMLFRSGSAKNMDWIFGAGGLAVWETTVHTICSHRGTVGWNDYWVYNRKNVSFCKTESLEMYTTFISYNKFQQTLAKKRFLIEELLFGQM